MSVQPPASPQRLGWLGLGAAAFCLACVVLSFVSQAWLPRLGPTGFVTEVCAALRTNGRVQAGVGWISSRVAYSNSMPPPFFWTRNHPNLKCGFVPWLPPLPLQGSFVFPP